MPTAKEFTSIFSQDWEINFLQCYPNGNLKYTDLCSLFQLTAASHAALGGISFTDMQEFNQAWVLSKMIVEIENLPQWNNVITVTTWIKSLENSRSVRCFELHHNGEKIVGCETFWVVFNTTTRRPENLLLPDAHFEKYPNKNATKNSFSRIEVLENLKFCGTKKIVLSDLDIVNHANSVKYVEWCLDCVESEKIIDGAVKSLEMNYLKEVALADVVTIEENTTENNTVFKVSCNGKVNFVLKLNSIL